MLGKEHSINMFKLLLLGGSREYCGIILLYMLFIKLASRQCCTFENESPADLNFIIFFSFC